MIKSFIIENFRLFDKVQVNHLSRVNLVVGKNNSGKSAFLEAVLLHHTKMSIPTIVELLRIRQEDWDAMLTGESLDDLSDPFRHFFKNHKLPEVKDSGFVFLSGSSDRVRVTTDRFYWVKDADENGIAIQKRKFVISEEDVSGKEAKRCVLVSCGSDTSVIDLNGKVPRPHRLREHPIHGKVPYKFISPQGVDDSLVAKMWDAVGLTDVAAEVMEGLKLIEPAITHLAFVESERRERKPIVKLDCFDVPVPLKSLGDGMTRILHIILSLVSCKGGILFIDEFETGLHWEVQPKIWSLVFELAKRLDVQVFASTHSRDCVSGFQKAWEDYEADGAFMRLSADDPKGAIQEYDLELLRDSIEMNVEVR